MASASEGHKSSLDLQATVIGSDLICAQGSRPSRSEGEVRPRRAVLERQANFWSCQLGENTTTNAINAFDLVTQELMLLPEEAPLGQLVLRQTQCELLADNAALWESTGG